jgi:glyoxylase-like metal-dependent hydrolase (beta-lactamase superfamily II)
MIEEILPGLYRIEVPLPDNPLRATNCYVIKAGARSLIIDTGMNRPECLQALSSGLNRLEVDPARADFFVTHMHSDHAGLVAALSTRSSTIYFGEADSYVARYHEGRFLTEMPGVARRRGFPEEEIQGALASHPGFRYRPSDPVEVQVVRDGDVVEMGGYGFRCIETPGHTRGHVCLYEPERKILVAGDHILFDITPNIGQWSPDDPGDPLRDYLASLDKVRDLPVELVLPGHRNRFPDLRQRVDELKSHHRVRADEVLRILENGIQNAYQVASQMTWDLSFKSWQQFPVAQKWFASGEALAHIRYLETGGRVSRESDRREVFFSLV